jgi:hypothetical protein
MVPLWVAELAAAFWDEAGEPGPFPRNLRRAARRAFPLSRSWTWRGCPSAG